MSNKLLIVDDESTVLKSLNRALASTYDVTTAYSGEEALQLLQRRSFAAVVTDMRMPNGDGASLIEQGVLLRPATQFIVLSGNCDHATRERMERRDTTFAFLTKPCSIGTLTEVIDQAIAMHARLCSAGQAAAV